MSDFKKDMGTRDILKTARASGDGKVKRIPGTAILFEFPSEQAVADAVNELVKLTNVTFIERNGFMRIPPKPEIPNLRELKKPWRGEASDQ